MKDDSVAKSCQDLNKVMSYKRRPLMLWALSLVVLLLLLYFWPSNNGHDHPKSEYDTSELATLSLPASFNHQHGGDGSPGHVSKYVVSNIKEDPHIDKTELEQHKMLLARQHAPAKVYAAKDGGASSLSVAGEIKNKVSGLSDASSYAKFANQLITNNDLIAKKKSNLDVTLMEGEIINATLETAINSDLPGMVRAVISKPVYSYAGYKVLIPSGSRLVGQYSSITVQGISRVFIIWQRVIVPSGIVFDLNSASSDSMGRSGVMANETNTHFMSRFGQGMLLSILGGASATAGVSSTDQDNSQSKYRDMISQNMQQQAGSSISATSAVKPTLSIFQGAAITILVAHDIVFQDDMYD